MSPVTKPASNRGGGCGNVVLSKLCSSSQAFVVVLQTLYGDSKPADSSLAFLTPPFHTPLLQLHTDQGLENAFGPSVAHHKLQHRREAQHVGKQSQGHGAAPPNLLPCQTHMENKQKIALVTPYFSSMQHSYGPEEPASTRDTSSSRC